MCGLLGRVDRARQRIGGVVRVISLAQRIAVVGEKAMELAMSSDYEKYAQCERKFDTLAVWPDFMFMSAF